MSIHFETLNNIRLYENLAISNTKHKFHFFHMFYSFQCYAIPEKSINQQLSPQILLGIGWLRCGIDRAHRVLFEIEKNGVGIGCGTNPFTKYSNSNLKYPTLNNLKIENSVVSYCLKFITIYLYQYITRYYEISLLPVQTLRRKLYHKTLGVDIHRLICLNFGSSILFQSNIIDNSFFFKIDCFLFSIYCCSF